MGKWRQVTAGDVGVFRGGTGFPLRLQGHRSGELPFFKVSDMNTPGNEIFMRRANHYIDEPIRRTLGAYRMPAGAIVFAKVGAAVFLERKRILSQDSCIDNNMSALILTDSQVDTRYVHYVLSSFAMASLAATTALPSLSVDQLRSIPLLLPDDLKEQQMVAATLADADDQIGVLERLLSKKRAMKQGMAQLLLSGRVRLPGFTTPWQIRPFTAVLYRVNAKRYQIFASSYAAAGQLPVVDQGQAAIAGYTDDLAAAFDPGSDGVVVFGDHTCISKFVDFKFAVGADGTQILKATGGNSTRFLAYVLEANPISSTGYNRHFKFLRERNFLVPEVAEQKAVADMLQEVDDEIRCLTERLEKARTVKLGMMQELLSGRTRLLGTNEAA